LVYIMSQNRDIGLHYESE